MGYGVREMFSDNSRFDMKPPKWLASLLQEDPGDGRFYLLMVAHHWGRGKSLSEAWKNLVDAGGQHYAKKSKRLLAFRAPEAADPKVDGFGALTWEGEHRPEKILEHYP